MRIKVFFILFALLLVSSVARANNLRLTRFDAVSIDPATHTMTLQMDIAQSNSWRNDTSHDAVWIFMKYSTDAGQTWRHATWSGPGKNPAGFTVPAGFEVFIPEDMKGLFFRRSLSGSGNFSVQALQLRWNYGQDGLSDATAAAANTLTRVYGIEMVYVPEGAFFAGDGESSSDFRLQQGSADTMPWYIANENAVTTTASASGGAYYVSTGAAGENSSGDVFLLSNSFPKGHRAFYMMKYELTEGQWAGFFNTLSVPARLRRDITSSVDGGKGADSVVNRNTLSWNSSVPASQAVTLRPDRAMTYISWPDAAAFADWAALRPMTELEYEKAARGVDINPVPDEFAWGSATYKAAEAGEIYPPNLDEAGEEAIFDGTANLNRNSLGWTSGDGRAGGPAAGQKGALRVGIFAENSTNRVTSGSGYYGNMELSGNVAEPVVTLGRAEGRQFLGTHGDGELTMVSGFEGNAGNVDWPGIDAQDARRGVTSTRGIGYRGGDFLSASVRQFQVSSRTFAAKDPDTQGYARRFDPAYGVVCGARFVRTVW